MERTARIQLAEERKRRNWSQRELADRLGTTQHNISRWEAGQTTPGPYFRAKLCALFGKSASALGLIGVHSVPQGASSEEPVTAGQMHFSDGDIFALWTVPYGRNPRFTGRDEILVQLDRLFFPEHTQAQALPRRAALTQPQAIIGLGGIGKTQIAVEYAYRSYEQGRYTHVLWINAASEEAILSSFADLAELLPAGIARGESNQHKLVRAIKRWLEQCTQPWLVIYDNADEVSLLQPYLPQRGNGSLLLTTRSHTVSSLATPIEVENMGLVEGTLFLLQRTQRQQTSEDERDEATNVVIALDGFPLALDQAGAYIEETGCSFGDYLALYQEHRQALLARRGKQTAHYPDSVATTWLLSFEKIAERDPAAAEMLQLCAFLAPDAIPEELLTQGAASWPLALQQTVTDRLRFHQLLENLLRFSLVKRRAENHTLSIHRLVQVVQHDRIAPEEQRCWAERMVRATSSTFPETVEVATWSLCQRLLSQAQVCSALIQEYDFVFMEAAALLCRTASYLYDVSLYEQAEALYRQSLGVWERALEPKHAGVATALIGLARVYDQRGKYEQAEPLYRQALSICEQSLGPDHPNVAAVLYYSAMLYAHQKKYKQAEPLYRQALAIREQSLGPDHRDVAITLGELGNMLAVQGKYEEAEALGQRAVRIWKQAQEPVHPWMAYSLNGLALLFAQQGKYEQAEGFFRQVLRIRERALGSQHADVAEALNNLGALYEDQQRFTEAEEMYQQAISIWEQALGSEHPYVAYPLKGLADLCRKRGHYEQAEALYQKVLHIWEHAFGPEHRDIAGPLLGLANLCRKRGMPQQAESLYQRTLSIQECTLGEHHPETAETLYDFAIFQEAQNKHQEAASLYQRALLIWEEILGAEHPKTLEARARLHAVLLAVEQPAGVERLKETRSGPTNLELVE